mmetsp:Transcript_36398/g.117688  ORF Transcript_36398/g.117688 Transcript_36398/m.117688 type:complete len:213 (-) Transcript_36398:1703-2341(-)
MASCSTRSASVDWFLAPIPVHEIVGHVEGHVDGPVLGDVALHVEHSIAVRQALPHVRNCEHRKGHRMGARWAWDLCWTDIRGGPHALGDARARLVPWLVVFVRAALAARHGIHDTARGVGPALQVVGFATLAHDPQSAVVQVLHITVPDHVCVASVAARRGAIGILGAIRQVTDAWHVLVHSVVPRVGAVVLRLGTRASNASLLAMRLLAVV